MSRLVALDLYENQLTGPIPSYDVGISKLTSIILNNNSLNLTTSCLFAQPSLEFMDLSNNKLQGRIPVTFYELQNLTYLSLSSNNLSGVVELDKLLRLKNLIHFDLSYSGPSLSINSSVNSTLPNFHTKGLASSNLSEFPNFLREHDALSSLDLQTTKFMV
ncbi:hypothetical protein ACSBR2_012676 [Camellia fascicularis]